MLKSNRWLVLGVLALLLAFVAAGCGQPQAPTSAPPAQAQPTAQEQPMAAEEPTAVEETTGEEEAAPEGEVTIEYWQYFFEPRVIAMDKLIEQFEAENPGIKVIHNSDIPYEQFRDQIAASAPAGVGPDVATLFYGWLPAWIDAGYLVPLPEDEFQPEEIEANFTPLVKAGKFQGKYWALPTAVRTLALFWNKDLFEAADMDPEAPPQTLDEFVDDAQQLTQYDDAGNILVEGYAPEMPGQAHQWFREVLVRQFGGQPFNDDYTEVMWDSPEGCDAFKWLAAFETEYNTGSDDLFDGATEAFLAGKEALHVDGSFRLGTIANSAPDLNFGVAQLPAGPNGERHTFGSYWTHGITRKAAADPARMDAAVKFLKFITSPEAGTLWVNEVGELPAQLEAANDPALLEDPHLGPFAESLSNAHATFFVDETKQRQALLDAYDAVRLTGADPCEELHTAAETVQELYDEFWAAHSE